MKCKLLKKLRKRYSYSLRKSKFHPYYGIAILDKKTKQGSFHFLCNKSFIQVFLDHAMNREKLERLQLERKRRREAKGRNKYYNSLIQYSK